MLTSLDHIIDQAWSMMKPAIYADVREGSGKAKFYLVDVDDDSVSAEKHEITRAAFNAGRTNGNLYHDIDDPLDVDGNQAWKVRTELDDDG